jgi:predicted  nucleic acid-binding Zn-ribbon protein
MMDSIDMSTPVTRGELQDVLSQVKQEHQRDLREATAPLATKAELQAAIAPLATKAELEMWGGVLVARIQQGEQRIGNLERGQEQLIGLVQQTQQQIQQTEQRLLAELARHTSAIHEAMRTEIKASIEPLADLPGRVSRLEAAVFGPTPRGRRTRRRSH